MTTARLRRALYCAVLLCGAWAVSIAAPPAPASKPVSLFDGTLDQWEGDAKMWRVQDGAITGGSLTETVTHNDFLCTKREYTNFILRMKLKLTGTSGFINSGIQVRTRRISNSHEVSGYQCDYGDPDWWGAIYDEGRRGKVLFPTDMIAVNEVLRRNDWNDYVIRGDGARLTVWLNGVQTADYYEDDPKIPLSGVFGIQIHGGGKALIQVKEITVEELPATAADGRFLGAPAPAKAAKQSPLSPEDQKTSFTLPPDFEIELVASESERVIKPITVVWDARGRMWTMTAQEYPVDANDNKEVAAALYEQPRRDKVLVFDAPSPLNGERAGVRGEIASRQPRVFADGFAIPLGLLPYKDGAFVQHGSDILFLRDTDGDGRADQREVVLTGFGIGDSHLMPHQFTRAPGGWILVAQGAFNNSQVRTKSGETVEFNRTLLGRFTPDGAKFETIGWGPCNIWGLVLNGEGEVFIQEANDYGYPVMPFHVGACYPGCTPFPKPYAPVFPGMSRLGMGGTGLSGLALSDPRGSFPGAYADVFYVANPVMQRIQAVKLFRDGPYYTLLKLPDFIRSSDEWFRPVAIHFGPDGCLYIVDWYNKVISHNEVPRNHPDRDKSHGRIWRVRHKNQQPRQVPDFTKLPEAQLVNFLGGDSIWQSHTAWQQIIHRDELKDRGGPGLRPELSAFVADSKASPAKRIQSLYALEGIQPTDANLLRPLLSDPSRNVRREAVRLFAKLGSAEALPVMEKMVGDPDPDVRAEVIRSIAPWAANEPRALALLVRMGHEPLEHPQARNTQTGKPMKVREAYDRDFERYLIRSTLEKHPRATEQFLAQKGASLEVEARLLASLALEPRASASYVAKLLPQLTRPAGEEELLRLAQFPAEPGVGDALKAVLQNPATRTSAAESLLRGRTRLDTTKLTPLMADAALALFKGDASSRELALRLTSGFQLRSLEPRLVAMLTASSPQPSPPKAERETQVAVLRALREIGSGEVDLFARLASESVDSSVQSEAILALASSQNSEAAPKLFALWPKLNQPQRYAALDRMASSKKGAEAIVAIASKGTLPPRDLDPAILDKLLLLVGENAELRSLLDHVGASARPVLRLDGKVESYVDSNITLDGPFTVETWIRLDPGISNDDGILGRPGGADFNFYAGHFRVYGGPAHGDRIIAKRAMTPELWTHVAATRDEKGAFRIYLDGELDNADSKPLKEKFTDLDIGRIAPAKGGTGAMLAEYRIWNRCRTADEIRTDFDRSFEGESLPESAKYFILGDSWGKLNGSARVIRTLDPPPVLTAAEARAQALKLSQFRALVAKAGDTAHGKQVAAVCLTCHLIQGQGGNIGPNLSGAGAMATEALLRSILTPNAAMEAGYRVFRVELNSDDIVDGFLVSQDKDAVILRIPNSDERRIPRNQIRRANFVRRSLMPEGLLEALPEKDATDLLAYLQTLK